MSVLVIVELTARPDRAAEFVPLLAAQLPDTRGFDGCEVCNVYVDQDDPTRFSIVETFTSRAHYERYFAWRGERGDLDALGGLLAGPPAVRFLDDTGA
jgi:quinol monooxygenase YgiN